MRVQVIVFRSCTPLAQSFLDYLFLGRMLPDLRSIIALGGVALGAYLYVLTDSEFQVKVRGAGPDHVSQHVS
jgi:GDP-mannose transporter